MGFSKNLKTDARKLYSDKFSRYFRDSAESSYFSGIYFRGNSILWMRFKFRNQMFTPTKKRNFPKIKFWKQ